MTATRRSTASMLVLFLGICTTTASGQNTPEIETRDGVRYQVTRRVVQRQVPTTVMEDRTQTVYTQQVTSDLVNHQQLCCVPTTQYVWDSQLRGRWNPFIQPYWTYNLKPVTTWHQQVANVQVPVSRVSWVPQTQTVQVPVTAYRPAEEEIVTRVALDAQSSGTMASSQPLTRPVTVAARPSSTASPNVSPIGGVAMENDPPRQATGWQTPSNSRYR